MFTGIVEEMGHLKESVAANGVRRMVFEASVVLEGTKVGDSVAVNGCCLTVVDVGRRWWAAEAVGETLARTNLGSLREGDEVNLERPVRLEDRLGGHLVQGHVDGIGVVEWPAPELRVKVTLDVSPYIAVKGSVTVDGCSLTVAAKSAEGFSVSIIPHTAAVTTLGSKRPGDTVNLEVDVIAKYVESLLAGAKAGG